MVSRATRTTTLTYGASSFGGSSSTYEIADCYKLDKDNGKGRLEVQIMVLPSASSTFASFEEIWRNPRQTCTFTYLGNTIISWNHSSGSGGVNTEARCNLAGRRETDSGLAHLYTVVITADLIPDGTDQSGIAEHRSSVVAPLDATKTVHVSGIYIGSDYATAVAAYVAEIKSRHSISDWVLLSETKEEGRDGKKVTWSREYRERDTASHDHTSQSNEEIDRYGYFVVSGVYTGSNYTTDVNSYCAEVKSRRGITSWVLIKETKDEGRDGLETKWTREYGEVNSDDLRDLKDSFSQDESRIRQFTISGVYTGDDFTTDADTRCAAIKSRHSVERWEMLTESRNEGVDGDQVEWTRVYQEIHFDEESAGLDHAAIIRAAFTVSSDINQEEAYDDPGGGPRPARFVDVIITFSCNIDATLIDDLEEFYKDTIRDALYNKGVAAFDGSLGAEALVGENHRCDYYQSRIDATMRLRGANGSTIFDASFTREAVIRTGVTLTPVFAASAYSAVANQGPAQYIVTTTKTRTRLVGAPSVGSTGTLPGWQPSGGSSVGGSSFGQSWASIGPLGGFSAGGLGAGIGGGVGSFFGTGTGGPGSGASGGSAGGVAASGILPSQPSANRPQNYAVIERRHTEKPRRIGTVEHYFNVIDEVEVEIVQFWDNPSVATQVAGRNDATIPALGIGAPIAGEDAEDFS